MTLPQIAGFIPALVFPLGTLMQLIQLYRSGTARGFSLTAWIAFACGNLCLYIYTGKYTEFQAISGLLLTFIFQLGIISLILRFRRVERSRS